MIAEPKLDIVAKFGKFFKFNLKKSQYHFNFVKNKQV